MQKVNLYDAQKTFLSTVLIPELEQPPVIIGWHMRHFLLERPDEYVQTMFFDAMGIGENHSNVDTQVLHSSDGTTVAVNALNASRSMVDQKILAVDVALGKLNLVGA
jgi:hypothetical protein